MKKILTLSMVLALSCSVSFAAGFGASLKQAIKSDVEATKADFKEAVKKDVEAKQAENKAKADAKIKKYADKKAERIEQYNKKLNELNAQLKEVEKSKTMTNTEKTIKTKAIKRQIEFYNKQKAAIQ